MTTQHNTPEALRIADELVETFFDRTRHEAAGELRRLHSVNTAQQKELMEQARLLGISAERELVFRAKVETLQRGYAAARQEIDSLRAAHGQAPAGATPWRSAVLDLIDKCPGLTMEQDRWLSRRVKELDFASAPRPTAQAAPAAVAGPSEAGAYLDIGTGGYLDLGTDLADEALSRLPKGRHALVIAGIYGIDGYAAAPPPSTTAQADSVQEDALSDSVRTPRDSLHADAAYLIGRLRDGSMPYARVIEIIRERIDAAKAAIRARACSRRS